MINKQALPKPLVSFYKILRYNDEPLLFQYSANSDKNILGSGISFIKNKAKIKAIGECFERYSLDEPVSSDYIVSSIQKLDNNGKKFLNPLDVVALSESQKKDSRFGEFNTTSKSLFKWILGRDLWDNSNTLIPAQLVYVPYKYSTYEPTIRLPISTGAALGISEKNAVERGIYEVIERDSFMIFYLNKISPPKFNPKLNPFLKRILEYMSRYRLTLNTFDLTSDIGVPVVMSIVTDETKIGPFLSVGLKCSLDIKQAIIGATEEAMNTRIWMRSEYEKIDKTIYESIVKENVVLKTPRDRGLYWYDGRLKQSLNFWLESNIFSSKKIMNRKGNIDGCSKLITLLKDQNLKSYWVDITNPKVRKLGYIVAKVIIPELHPLYLYEAYPYHGGRRLYSVPKKLGYRGNFSENGLNMVPHPFL